MGSISRIDAYRYVARRIDACQYVLVRAVPLISRDCCPPVLDAPIDVQQAEQMAAALRVIADPTRLRLVSILAASERREACVCDLTEPLGLSQPTVSHHLKVLAEAGVVEREQRGRWAYFRLRPAALATLRRALAP
jgi:ArsR family transcriptional regulator